MTPTSHLSMITLPERQQGPTDDLIDARLEEVKNTPLFSSSVRDVLDGLSTFRSSRLSFRNHQEKPLEFFSQRGLLGLRLETFGSGVGNGVRDQSIGSNGERNTSQSKDTSETTRSSRNGHADETVPESVLENDLVYANLTAPWSAFICGSQGSGKSHTLSCLLENNLITPSQTGLLNHPMAALVFHYDKFVGYYGAQVCEAAYLCSAGIPVRVLVSPSNVHAMRTLYRLPGLPPSVKRPEVIPMYFSDKQLNVGMMKTLMSVTETDGGVPLYMEMIMKILRDMARDQQFLGEFNYSLFRQRLNDEKLVHGQAGPMNMRLQLLESFLTPCLGGKLNSKGLWQPNVAEIQQDIWNFQAGTLTIVDLSCPFVGQNDACALFNICLPMFLERRDACGRLIALDEAHKAAEFNESLLSIVRQQRHLATRVIIATQEPTLSPALLDLCNVSIIHRFSSPAWFQMLEQHLAGVHLFSSDNPRKKKLLFEHIVRLRTGEALVFSPTSILDVKSFPKNCQSVYDPSKAFMLPLLLKRIASLQLQEQEEAATSESDFSLQELGPRYVRIKVRNRLTADGGVSIMAL